MEIDRYVFYERVKRPIKFCFDKYFCPKYIGLENIPKPPYILAGNHTSMMDIPLLACGIKEQINFMAKEELFKKQFAAWILENLKAISVSRGKRDLTAFREAILRLRDGEVLGIFPEGTRNKGDELLEFKSGTELLARVSNVPVVPFGITGEYKFRSHVCLSVGTPINPTELGQNPDILKERVKELIRR